MRHTYVLWLLTAVVLLALTTRAAHVREASGSSLASSNTNDHYANDPRPDAVNEETSDILGTGGAYEFRLPQPQINKQQHQQQQQKPQQQQHHKTKRPNTTVTYITNTKTSSSTSSSSSSNKSGTASISSQMTTKSSTARPSSSSTTNTSGQKTANGTSLTTTPAQSIQQSNLMDNNSQPSYQSTTSPVVVNDEEAGASRYTTEKDDDATKKILGTSVVTSVSVVLNGDEPEFTDALGHKLPKPQGPLHVASPIDLLNPDRYEFYTFDDNGDLVKRLMTIEEIQSIVANGDGENSPLVQYTPVDDRSEPEKNVQDIVDSVQNVLNKEVESNKNISKDALPTLDTPDVTSTWSMILPAIFGNGAGGSTDLFLQQKPQQIIMTPDSELVETSTSAAAAVEQHATKRPKPSKRKPGQKRKPTTAAPSTAATAMTPQVVQEELGPEESVYTGMQQYQNTAANMQHFDGFSQLQMQPIYHKLPEQAESTSHRIIVNQQAVEEGDKTTRPSVVADEKVELNPSFGKRPTVVGMHNNKRPVYPHRNKTPNGGTGDSSTTHKPQGIHNKQKIKKKPTAAPATTTTTTTTEPTTTTTTTTSTTPEPTTTTTTTTPAPTTTTTSTPEPETTTTPEPTTSSTTHRPSATTPKKKKKKPTRQPGQGTSSKPHPLGEKRKPGTGKPSTGKPRPTGAAQHSVHKPQQSGLDNKHPANTETSTTEPTSVEPTINKHTVSHKPTKTRPRPHKKPTTTTPQSPTTTTTTTPEPTTPEPTTTTIAPPSPTTSENTLVVEHFPGHPIHTKHSYANKRPGGSHYPVPVYKPTEHKVVEAEPADFGHLKRKPLPSLSQIQQHHKPTENPILPVDQQTLTSFDQIMESLKVELADKMDADINEPSASEKRPMIEKLDVEKPPAAYASGALIKEQQESASIQQEEIQQELITTMSPPTLAATSEEVTKKTTTAPLHESTTQEINEEEAGSADAENVSEYSTEEYAATLENKDNDKTGEDLSGVVKFEPLYANMHEPIVAEVATTAETFIDDPTTQLVEQNNKSDGSAGESSTEYQLTGETMNSPVTNKVEALIAEDKLSTTEPQPQVADLKPHLNINIIKPTSQMNMSDFQDQAATVASALVDGGSSYDLASSNDTGSELDFLISDVLQQITANDRDEYRVESAEDANRFTNFAQLNSSFLLKPTQATKLKDDVVPDNLTNMPTTFKDSTEESTESALDEAQPELNAAAQVLTYASKDDAKTEPEKLVSEKVSAEKPEKEIKAELSDEILETKETMHEITLSNKDKYEVEETSETKAENFENTNERLDENPLAQLETTEKYDIETTTNAYAEEYESTTQEEKFEDKLASYETKNDSENLEANKMDEKIDSAVTESISESGTTELLISADSSENKKDEVKSAEEIITEISKINDAETAKINEAEIAKIKEENESNENNAEAVTEPQEFETTTEEFGTHTENSLKQEVTDTSAKEDMMEEQSTEQETVNKEKEEEEGKEKEEEDKKAQIQAADSIDLGTHEKGEQEAETNKSKLQEEVPQETKEMQVKPTKVGIEHEELPKEGTEDSASETKISSAIETNDNSQKTNDNERDGEEKDDDKKESTIKKGETETEIKKQDNEQKVANEKIVENEEVKDRETDEENVNEKETIENDTNDEVSKEETSVKETHKQVTNEGDLNNQESSAIVLIEKETLLRDPISMDSLDKDSTEKESIEKEESSQVAAITPTLDEVIAEQTILDATEELENTTEKDTTEQTEDDNATNANNLELHYTNVPATEKHDPTEQVEYSSESDEHETTTTQSVELGNTTPEKEATEKNDDRSGAESSTDVTMIQPSAELDSTESEEDAYIKLGETTTRATEKMDTEEIASESINQEKESESTEGADIETTTMKLLHFKERVELEPLKVDVGSEEEEKTELPQLAAAEPSKKVEVIAVEPANESNKPAELIKETAVSDQEHEKQPSEQETVNPIQEYITLQRPHHSPQPNIDYRPDAQNPADAGDLTSYIVPKFPISPVLAALAKKSNKTTSVTTNKNKNGIPTQKPIPTSTKRIHTLKPVSYYNKHGGFNGNAPKPVEPTKVIPYSANVGQQRPMMRPAQLNNLMATSTQATRPPVKMEPSPTNSKGLEASVSHIDEDLQSFVRLCNELAFTYWKSITAEKISSARSLVVSPFALTSMLSMVFLGARGSTSGEMNEVLKLDDMVTFNPHLVFRNITDSVEHAADSDIATAAFVREIFSDRANGKILQFFKEKTQQFYAGHVEEVNFNVVNDVIRRRTNLLVKRHTMGKVLEYLRTNSLWVNGPLATISANLFQTDCRRGSTHLTDGEMFFQVHPSVRQRRLIPIPAVLYKSGFTAGYEPTLDATVVAFGSIQDTVSTIYVMPGHQSTLSQAESLERLERDIVEQAIAKNAWSNILTALMDRPGMEVQLPRFSHRSFVNASLGLQKMGLKGLFKSDFADLRGLTGSSNRDIYLSDVIQINTFSTCGEEKIGDQHHVEMYPAPPLRKRNKDLSADDVGAGDEGADDSSEAIVDFGSLVHDSALARGFYDDLLDPKYLELPLSLRPRQARVPDAPRLRFDKPFLYFVRHNPTGIILFMGRFNPRLLP